MSAVYGDLLKVSDRRGGAFLLLIDPDRTSEQIYLAIAEAAADCGVDGILVGTSFMLGDNFGPAVRKIKERTELPVIIFPGSFAQITPHADAILFTSLISSRNPNYLIEEQVRGAPLVRRYGIEAISTGYMLIESGNLTSVQYISNSFGIPRDKHDIACAHAMAAEYLGMKLVYLEAGSGATHPVPIEMVQQVTSYIDIPVMVGGGLRTAEDCAGRVAAGARFVVMGNHFEDQTDTGKLIEFAAAAHPREPIGV